MKRLNSSDSFGALMSICQTSTEEHSPRSNNHVYSRELQSMLDGLDEEGCIEESIHAVTEKKRRLSVNQVKALEKNFEVENKLEPERKVKLAQELGLQPRQVAVWFQNRRARWKTKQLERDYGVLKANYESLEHNYDALRLDNEALLKEIRELKAKLNEENTESNISVKEEPILPETDHKAEVGSPIIGSIAASETKDLLDYESCFNYKHSNSGWREGLSDSDSSAILNDDNSPNPAISSSGAPNHHDLVTSPPPSTSIKFNSSTSSSSPSSASMSCIPVATPYQIQFVKTEEHNFFCSEEEACNFFSDQQAPTLQW